MTLRELLLITERPRRWSRSSYYRLRSASQRILKNNNCEMEIDMSNLDSVLKMLNLKVTYKNGVFKTSNRTYKTYITEVKRYITHNLKNKKNGN